MCDVPQPPDRDQNDDSSSDEGKREQRSPLDDSALEALTDTIVAHCGTEALARLVGMPFDEARISYVADSMVVQSEEEFIEKARAFYLHVLAYTGGGATEKDNEVIRADVLALLDTAFEHSGGWRGALEKALTGRQGGLRIVFDMMADQLRNEAETSRINAVFREYIEPLDDDSRSRLIRKLGEKGNWGKGKSFV